MTTEVVNISTYKFIRIYDSHILRQVFQNFCDSLLGMKGRIIVSSEGINIGLAGTAQQIEAFGQFLHQDDRFSDMVFKYSLSTDIPFDRLVIKRKNHIVPAEIAVDTTIGNGTHLSAEKLKQWLDENRDFTLLDTRNDHEIEHGTFDRACDFNIENFKEIYAAFQDCDETMKQKPMVMFCTGGIRCEKGLPLALAAGFKEVYQLDGGILKYLEECGDTHYHGECYVFDQRETVDSALGRR